MTQESLRGRLASAGLACAIMPAMGEQTESPTMNLGGPRTFCGERTLVLSPSGLNLVCTRCDRITLLLQEHRPDDRPVATRHGRIPGRHRKRF